MIGDLLEKLSPEDRLVWDGSAEKVRPEAVAALVRSGEFDWHKFLTTARDNRVVVRLSDTLLETDSVPSNIKAALGFYENKVRRSVEGDRGAFERAMPAIRHRNEIILLRGMAHAYTFDRERPTRMVGTDVDLVIDRPQYASLSGRFLDHHHIPSEVLALSPPRLEYHHDLNFKSSWCVRLARFDMRELWERRHIIRVAGLEAGLLSAEDEIVYLSYHNAAKRFVRLYRFVDLVQVIRSNDIDWSAVVDRARRYRVERAVWANLSVARSLSPESVPDDVMTRLEPSRWVRAILRKLFHPELILHDWRIESDHTWSRWMQSIRRGLFFRSLLVRPDNFAKILIGPVNLALFLLYSGAARTRLLGSVIGRVRAVVQRDRVPE